MASPRAAAASTTRTTLGCSVAHRRHGRIADCRGDELPRRRCCRPLAVVPSSAKGSIPPHRCRHHGVRARQRWVSRGRERPSDIDRSFTEGDSRVLTVPAPTRPQRRTGSRVPPSTPADVATRLGVDPAVGLSADEATPVGSREHGANELAAAPQVPGVEAVPRPVQRPAHPHPHRRRRRGVRRVGRAEDAAGGASPWCSSTQSSASCRRTEPRRRSTRCAACSSSQARVRRDGELHNVDTAQLVPGDIVLVEAGDRIPADGRLLTASTPGDRGGRAHRREQPAREVHRRPSTATTSRSATAWAWRS